MKSAILALAALCLGVLPAAADEILLTNGRKLVGLHIRDPKSADKVTVEVPAGVIVLDAKMVSSVNPGRTLMHDYHDRAQKLEGSKSASDLWGLATWCKENKLTGYVPGLAHRTIAADPEHAAARAELRFVKRGGKWLTWEQDQEAQGKKLVDGRWMTQAEIELIEKAKAQAAAKRAAAEEEKAKKAAESQERHRKMMEEVALAQARQVAMLDGYFHSPSFAFTTPYFRPYWWAPYVRSRRYYQEGWMYSGGGGYTYDLFRFIPNPYQKK
jgi:hypothetical protein